MWLLTTLTLCWLGANVLFATLMPWLARHRTQFEYEATMARMRHENILMVVEVLTDTLEATYALSSAHGFPYADITRWAIAERIGVARALLADRRGEPEPEPIAYAQGYSWPFDKQGKVKL